MRVYTLRNSLSIFDLELALLFDPSVCRIIKDGYFQTALPSDHTSVRTIQKSILAAAKVSPCHPGFAVGTSAHAHFSGAK